jgi:hypothetical protein
VDESCRDLARARVEPLAGTAPVATGWLLIEQPGSWGRDALTGSGLDPAIGASLTVATQDLPVRAQLIRRPVSATPPLPTPAAAPEPTTSRAGRRVVLTHAGPTPWAEVLDDVTDQGLLDLPVERLTDPRPPGLGRTLDGPLLLVCTHSKRDRCCALAGRPIAAALATEHPGKVWETSHVGGHRFAGNLVVLPEGLVYGGLDPTSASEVAARHIDGEVSSFHLRGRSHLDRPVQAAEVLVRQELGVDGTDALRVTTSQQLEASTLVEFDVAGERWGATVRLVPLGSTARLSCDADEEEDPGRFELVELHRAAST